MAEACPHTIVIVNAGSPVTMPWLDAVDAVLYTWFPGQEMGDALVDVAARRCRSRRAGCRSRSRLSLEDTPAFEHHPGRNGVANYLEGRLIGYRWYDTVGRPPLFPFGFGLGYADVDITAAAAAARRARTVDVDLVNESDRDGVQVVQVYAGPHG